MSTNKQAVKVTISYEDGSTQVVEPGSGHSVILAVTKNGSLDIETLIAGKMSELCSLFDRIIENNPEILAIVTVARMAEQTIRNAKKSGGKIDEALSRIPEPKEKTSWN